MSVIILIFTTAKLPWVNFWVKAIAKSVVWHVVPPYLQNQVMIFREVVDKDILMFMEKIMSHYGLDAIRPLSF